MGGDTAGGDDVSRFKAGDRKRVDGKTFEYTSHGWWQQVLSDEERKRVMEGPEIEEDDPPMTGRNRRRKA